MTSPNVVVGAGAVGLAIAAELAENGADVVVIERHDGPGRETSSRNSEVIHAGLYYPVGSLKARLCVRGNELLYPFCHRFGVAHRRLGKLVVACDARERDALEQIAARGRENGAQNLRLLGQAELARLEPRVRAIAALLSPSSGIVDSHGLIKALEARARAAGAIILYRCRLCAIDRDATGFSLLLANPSGSERLAASRLINCAGLAADEVAALAGVDAYRLHWCKGEYFAITGAAAQGVTHLVYPVPLPQLRSLGVHVTPDLAGRLRLGPDATYVTRGVADHAVDGSKADAFHSAVARFLPDLPRESLRPDTAGIRPKLQAPDAPWQDFIIREESDRGCPGLIDLIGIESPGLTAALAIAERVRDLAQ